MKLAKRIFAILLVLVMSLAIFVGCNDDTANRLSELEEQLATQQAAITAQQQKIEELEAELGLKQAAILSLTENLVGLTNGLDDSNRIIAALQDELAKTKNDLVDSNKVITALSADLQKLSNTVAQTYEDGKFVVLHTNDTHGKDVASDSALGMASLLALRRIYEQQGYTVILVDAGDAIMGTSLVNMSYGATAIEFMNLAGYDIAVPGNHEFDWGLDNLLDLVDAAEFEYICANLVWKNTEDGHEAGDSVFSANKIISVGGTKIGFFGLTTPETATKTNPNNVASVNFLAGEELYACAQVQVDLLQEAGCDVIIALGHLGIDSESDPNRSIDLIGEVEGIDVFIDGHSHSRLENVEVEDAAGNTTILASTGSNFQNIGVITFDANNAATSHILSNADTSAGLKFLANVFYSDAVEYINEINNEIATLLSVKFAETEVDLIAYATYDDGNEIKTVYAVRAQETNLGNFATDALLWAARSALGDGAVDAALTNGGGIRADIKIGDVTMDDMKTVFPYGNTLTVISLTGEQLWEALEAATYIIDGTLGNLIGGFPQVSGIVYEIDTRNPWEQGSAYPGTTYNAPGYVGGIENENKRVTITSVNGKAFDKDAVYTIATNNFTAAGGDTYHVFKSCSYYYDTGIAMEDALVNYTSVVLNNIITAAAYGPATVGNRITIITA